MLLPTPPLPERIKIRFFTEHRFSSIKARSGSGPLGAVEHICWLGHPAHAEAFPASSVFVPGQSIQRLRRWTNEENVLLGGWELIKNGHPSQIFILGLSIICCVFTIRYMKSSVIPIRGTTRAI